MRRGPGMRPTVVVSMEMGNPYFVRWVGLPLRWHDIRQMHASCTVGGHFLSSMQFGTGTPSWRFVEGSSDLETYLFSTSSTPPWIEFTWNPFWHMISYLCSSKPCHEAGKRGLDPQCLLWSWPPEPSWAYCFQHLGVELQIPSLDRTPWDRDG